LRIRLWQELKKTNALFKIFVGLFVAGILGMLALHGYEWWMARRAHLCGTRRLASKYLPGTPFTASMFQNTRTL